ncbi:MAG: signal peptidase II [Puniceicoccales bacterium]|jgi:signal peptidase II|nr:signal peptidase II [Puniceicoccales bacterium]
MRRRSKFFLWGLLSSVVLLDQTSKCFAEIYLKYQSFTLNRWLSFSLSHNTGCAWSLLQGQTAILGFFGIVALFFICYLHNAFGIYERPIAFGLLLGGILGNVIDRLCRGFVVDFIDINLQIYRWPTFNIADAAMCIAVFTFLFSRQKNE